MAEIIGMNDLTMQPILDENNNEAETDDDKDRNTTILYLKIFDNALREINDNLRDSFLRFKINHIEFEADIDIDIESNMMTEIEMSTV